jgi:FkbM family methyltransferase
MTMSRFGIRKMPGRHRTLSIKSVLKAHPRIYRWTKGLGAALGWPVYRPEEEWLAEFARRRRGVFFLQIGAHDGKTDDKLYAFVRECRWKGVLVEPVKYLFDRLVTNYAEAQGLVFENAALMAQDGSAVFYHLRQTDDPLPPWYDQLGSFSREVILSHKAAIPNIEDYLLEETVECISFATLVARHKVRHIDVILIDTEGYDFEILKNIEFQRYRPKLVIYEHKHLSPEHKTKAIRLLKRYGYFVHPCGMNNVAVRSWLAHFSLWA